VAAQAVRTIVITPVGRHQEPMEVRVAVVTMEMRLVTQLVVMLILVTSVRVTQAVHQHLPPQMMEAVAAAL